MSTRPGMLMPSPCNTAGLTAFRIAPFGRHFEDVCVAVGLNGGYLYRFGRGPTPFQAQQNMTASCVAGQVVCTLIRTDCDTTSSAELGPSSCH